MAQNSKHILGWSLGVTAVAAAAFGAYMLYGPDGKRRRTAVKSWMLKMKGDILEQLENAKEVNEEVYKMIVDTVAKKYKDLKSIEPKELAAFVAEMIELWQQRSAKTAPRRMARKATSKRKK